jgi:cysteine-rich repeat protein
MGRMSLGRSFDAAARILVDETQILDATGATWSVSGAIVDPILPFRVTLAFTDAPGPTVGNAWVNDLDLEVTVDSGSGPVLYRGNHFSAGLSVAGGTADPRNNVESVWLPAGTTGTFTVTVRAQNIAGDGVPGVGDGLDQDFALVVYNGSDAVCGNGAVEFGETCDDGNAAAGDGCSDACQVEGGFACSGAPSACGAVCGDGLVLGAESCDDGNTSAGDGCSEACQVEGGFACSGAPSACGAVCGDGLVLGSESCDDGNTAAGDGCSGACAVEPGFACWGQPSACEAAAVPTASSAARSLLSLLLLAAGALVLARRAPREPDV